jgi:hypothetical protein
VLYTRRSYFKVIFGRQVDCISAGSSVGLPGLFQEFLKYYQASVSTGPLLHPPKQLLIHQSSFTVDAKQSDILRVW